MKKQTILKSTLCMLLAMVCNATWAQVEFSFTRSNNKTATVTAPVGLTATMTTNVDWLTANNMGTNTNVLCPNRNTSQASGENFITFTLTVSGLQSGQEFDAVSFTHKTVNSQGNFQPANNIDIRHCNFKLEANGEVVKTLTDKNIWIQAGYTEKVFTLGGNIAADENGALTLKLTISKGTSNNGCFYGLTKIVLDNTHTLEIGNSGYATLMLGYNATIPAGATCYAAAVEGDKAMLTAIEGTLAANTPVLVKGEENDYVFEPVDYASPVTGNELRGTLSAKDITPEAGTVCYVLAKPEELEIGFYRAALSEEGSFLNNANKAYLPVAGTSAARISFDFGTETAIESVESVENNAVVYDLAGRRVQGAQKGIFIVNGKKVIK